MNCSSYNVTCKLMTGMNSKAELHDHTFMEKQDPSKDVLMEDMRCIDSKVNSEEKSNFMNPSFFQSTFSRGTFTKSTIKGGDLGISKQETNVPLAKLVTAVVIAIVIAIFLVPIIIYHVFKSDPILPELNSTLGDVNISMVNYCALYIIANYCLIVV